MAKYLCGVCGFIYDEEKEGKKWEELPDDWVCPVCGAGKSSFNLLEPETKSKTPPVSAQITTESTGKKLVICSVCGYISEEGQLGEMCPACGVAKTAFQPYVDEISAKRRKVLNLHLHNIVVHFPQAFSILMLFLIFMAFFIRGSLQSEFMTAAKILSIFLPLSVLASILSGVLDGKNRFKRTDTPILKKKLIVGIIFLVFSIVVLLILNFSNLLLPWRLVVFALTALCALSSLFLGYNGGRLAGLEVPGS